jgi:hypothetical protein
MGNANMSQFEATAREHYLPTCISNLPGNLHLLGGALVQLLQAARQLPLNRRRLHRPPARVHPVTVGPAAERRAEHVVAEYRRREPGAGPHAGRSPHAAAHAPEGAGRAEEFGEDVLRVARVEPEHVRPVAARGEEGRAPGARPAGAWRRHLPLKPLLAVLVVHRALLRVAQNLLGHETSGMRHNIAEFLSRKMG